VDISRTRDSQMSGLSLGMMVPATLHSQPIDLSYVSVAEGGIDLLLKINLDFEQLIRIFRSKPGAEDDARGTLE